MSRSKLARAACATLCLLAVALAASSCRSGNKKKAPPGRQAVLVEIDRMAGTPAIPDLDTIKQVFAAGGIDMRIVEDQSNLPAQPTVGRGDLHGLMTSFRSLTPNDDEWHVYLLVATAEVKKPEDAEVLGVMFDYNDAAAGVSDENGLPREGCAVFANAQAHRDNPKELLLTTVHELAHCFNIHHTDWEGGTFNDHSTIESYSFVNTVKWKLSAKSIAHLNDHEREFVKPGRDGVPFGTIREEHAQIHQNDPTEVYDVVRTGADAAKARRDVSIVESSAERRATRTVRSAVKLRLTTPSTRVALGHPVQVTARLTNGSAAKVRVLGGLDPSQQMLRLEIKRGREPFRMHHPPVWSCARQRPTELAPSKSIEATFPIFVGTRGWTLNRPGTYQVRASYPAELDENGRCRGVIASNTLRIDVRAAAAAPVERTQRQLFGHGTGLYLYLGGCSHLETAEKKLKRAYDSTSLGTEQRRAIGVALGNAALAPTLARKRRAVNFQAAERYLDEALKTKQAPWFTEPVLRKYLDALRKKGKTDKVRKQSERLDRYKRDKR